MTVVLTVAIFITMSWWHKYLHGRH